MTDIEAELLEQIIEGEFQLLEIKFEEHDGRLRIY